MALSRTDIDERLKKINNDGFHVLIERNSYDGYYLVITMDKRHYYFTIREVLGFLDGYLDATTMININKKTALCE